MNLRPTPRLHNRALTLVEVLVVIGVVFILMFLLTPTPHRGHKKKAQRFACVSNLKQVGLGMIMYAYDHDERFPWKVPLAQTGSLEYADSPQVYRHFVSLTNELNTPRILTCPADAQRTRANEWRDVDNSKISYFVGLDATNSLPNEILSGDRNVAGGSNGIRTVPITNKVTWTAALHVNAGNIGLVDGSVQQMTSATLRQQLSNSVHTVLRWAIP